MKLKLIIIIILFFQNLIFSQQVYHHLKMDSFKILVRKHERTSQNETKLEYIKSFIQIDFCNVPKSEEELLKIGNSIGYKVIQLKSNEGFHLLIDNYSFNMYDKVQMDKYKADKKKLEDKKQDAIHKKEFEVIELETPGSIPLKPQNETNDVDINSETISLWSRAESYRIQLFSISKELDNGVKTKIESVINELIEVENKDNHYRYLIYTYYSNRKEAEEILEKKIIKKHFNSAFIVEYNMNKNRITE